MTNSLFCALRFTSLHLRMSNDSEIELPDEQSESGETLYERTNIIVDRGQEPMRLDKFLTARIEGASRNKVQQAIETGRVLVNNKKVQANHKIKPGEEIVVYSDRETHSEEIIPEPIPLNIVYEDDEVMIVNKPVGLVVHPASGNYNGTLVNGIAWHLLQQNSHLTPADLPRYGLVHRIDKNTSGLMVIAKTGKALASLARQFFDHTVHRQYVALVWGDVENDSGTIGLMLAGTKDSANFLMRIPTGNMARKLFHTTKCLSVLDM